MIGDPERIQEMFEVDSFEQFWSKAIFRDQPAIGLKAHTLFLFGGIVRKPVDVLFLSPSFRFPAPNLS